MPHCFKKFGLQNISDFPLSLSRNGPQNKPRVHFIFGFVHLNLASDLPQSCVRSTIETASKTPQDCLRFTSEAASEVTLKLPQVSCCHSLRFATKTDSKIPQSLP
jgi:hypothetical protein